MYTRDTEVMFSTIKQGDVTTILPLAKVYRTFSTVMAGIFHCHYENEKGAGRDGMPAELFTARDDKLIGCM